MGYVFDFKDTIAYEQWLYHPRNKRFTDLAKQLMCDMLLPKKGETLLDIGCGTGANLLSFLEMGLEVTGLDPSPYMLDIASKIVCNRADLHRGSAEDLPFEDNSFNYSCFMTTLEFVENPKKAIAEVSRVTKDRIFIGVLNRYAIKGIQMRIKGIFIKTIYNHAQFFSILELKKIIRSILGDVPIVASLDLHAVLTDAMVRAADVLVPFHTYPHIDQYETGQRAARVLLRLLEGDVSPSVARVELPMLVRGDELITATGRFGTAIKMCREIENSHSGLAAGVIIGNAFTDVPDLQSNVLVTTDEDPETARREAERIARFMWQNRELFQAELTPLDESIKIARRTDGLTVFSDAADATASGAPGDSNAILKGLLDAKYPGRVLMTIVDSPAVEQAFLAGIGATIDVALGGTRDPGRFTPVTVNARVKSLSDGEFCYEDGTLGRGGRTAVLIVGNINIVVTERSVYVVGRKVFLAQGLDPRDYDVVVVKSPNGFRTYYEEIAACIVPVDVPGATSANLKSLPFSRCVRPIFPLDEDVSPCWNEND